MRQRPPLLPLLLVSSAALAPLAPAQEPPPSVTRWARLLEDGAWSAGLHVDVTAKDGLRDSRDDLSDEELFAQGYTRATDTLNDRRALLSVARGLEGWTVFATLPLVDLEREGRTDGGGTFTQDTAGIGDLELGTTRVWRRDEEEILVWSVALSLPTGSIDDEQDGEVLPYPLQPGSGTVDLLPGVSWTHHEEGWSWGLAARGRLELGRNTDGWARSRSLVADGWVGKPLGREWSGRLGLRNSSWGDLHGESDEIQARAGSDPLADADRQGGTRTDLLVGLDWRPAEAWSVSFEVGTPLDEWLDGPQPSTELVGSLAVSVGW